MNTKVSPVTAIAVAYRHTHQRVLERVADLSGAQLAWRPMPRAHSIAFHVWHLGRWADHLQAAIPAMTAELARRLDPGVQVWEAEGLAARWGFEAATLGYAETGMLMDDDLAVQLPFPSKDVLLAYVRQAFAAAESTINGIDEQQFQETERPQPMTEGVWEAGGTVGDAIISHLMHDNQHRGMIECLYGLQVRAGAATV